MRRTVLIAIATVAVAGVVAMVLLEWLQPDRAVAEVPLTPGAVPDLLAAVERGRYLARVGNCRACHTRRGGADYAGGRAIPTPFGRFFSPNITPHDSALGRWSADDFWRAMHEGRSRDGRLLYPVFPYTNYTRVTREDADALFHYLRSVDPVAQSNRPHELRFPYQWRPLLAGWRLLYFRPGVYESDPQQSAAWNRGAYLVQGLGHCSACHAARNALGGMRSRDNPAGGLVLSWYAPSLQAPDEAGLQDWGLEAAVALLRTGIGEDAAVLGPMAEVTYESLQHWTADDARAMAVYLRALPRRESASPGGLPPPQGATLDRLLRLGAGVYEQHCAACHGDEGEGRRPAGPALAGNRAVLMASVVNPIRVVMHGGYPPGTAGNPRPFGMPPYAGRLSDEEIAGVLSHIRTAWGNEASAVSPVEVRRHRGGPLW